MAFPPEASLHAVAFAALSAGAFGAALVITHSGLKRLDAMSGAKVSIPMATLLTFEANRRLGPTVAGVPMPLARG